MAFQEGTGSDSPPDVDFDVKERAMDEAPVGIVITDSDRPDNPVVYVNDTFERITGYERSDILGRNCRFLQGPQTDEKSVAELAQAVDAEASTTVELLNYRANGERFWNEVTIAPVRNGRGEVTHFVGFQMDVTARKRAEIELQRERENLSHLLERIDGLVSDVMGAVAGASSRKAVERQVCDRLAAVDDYSFAWVGDVDFAGDEIEPRAWSGDEEVGASDLAVSLEETDHPGVKAIQSGSVQVVTGDDAAAFAPAGEVLAIVAVPLVYRDRCYGVLVVCPRIPNTLNDRETTVLEALGRTVATALNAHESRQVVSADHVVTLELTLSDRSLFFVDIATRADCWLEYEGAVSRDETPLLFFSTDGNPAPILEAAEETENLAHAAVVDSSATRSLFEFRPETGSLVSEFADRGARVQRITAADGRAEVEVELPASTDVRTVVEDVQSKYPGTELVSYREAERPPSTEREFVAELADRLTKKQRTAIQKAYLAGYYDSSRSVTGEELATSMDVSRATFHQHRRAGERKLMDAFFDQ